MIISKVHVTNVSTIKLMTTSICVCYDCDKIDQVLELDSTGSLGDEPLTLFYLLIFLLHFLQFKEN